MDNFNVFAEDVKVILNDSKRVLNAAQKEIDGTVYAPLRPVLEASGWNLVYDSINRSVCCIKENRQIVITIGSRVVDIDGEQIILDKPVVISDGITYIPSKFIAQKFGVQIMWNKNDNFIILSDYDEDDIYLEGNGNIIIAGNGIIVNIFEPYD